MVGKSSLQEIATLAFIQEISDSKIWSLQDYPGELTALDNWEWVTPKKFSVRGSTFDYRGT